MTTLALVLRSLRHFQRSNLAVAAGIATAVAVLAGALLVGNSVRASLRRLALERIGNAHSVVRTGTLFREALAGAFTGSAPMLVLEGVVSQQSGGRRAAGVPVYGVDDRFWKLHGVASPGLVNRDAAMSAALAEELAASAGETVLLRLEKPADIPAESLFGRKESAASSIRFTVKAIVGTSQMGDFALRPQQGAVKALFVPLSRLQKEVGAAGRINTILTADPADEPLRTAYTLEDLGIRIRSFDDRKALQLETTSGVIADDLATIARKAAEEAGLRVVPVFTYMANSMKIGARELPYSLIAAIDMDALGMANAPEHAIVFNQWAAQDLGAKPGDAVTMQYMLWHSDGRLTSETAQFTVADTVPMKEIAADRDLAPEYPGITDAANVADWDPPFPMDLGKIRPKDEDYWDAYRTTPKAFLPLARGQQLWNSRWGKVTALRLLPTRNGAEELGRAQNDLRVRLRKALDPAKHGLAVLPLREQSLAASRGATDFGEYFSYFSFFLMASALMLAGLFFRLGIEQRAREVGLLRAVGFASARVRSLFLLEGALLATAGAVIGVLGAIAYAAIVLHGLGTWWVDAVGTRELRLDLNATPLIAGAVGALLAAFGAIWWTLRGLEDFSARQLLNDGAANLQPAAKQSRYARKVALGAAGLAAILLALSAAKAIPAAGGFFGVGLLLLVAALAFLRTRLGGIAERIGSQAALARRNAGYRPGRTVLSAALIASATFLIVSVEAFRRDAHDAPGAGGYTLIGESVRPLYHNPATAEGRAEMNLPDAEWASFRLRPGDDASCLNLYQPQNPRVLGAPSAFLRSAARFAFASTEEKADNPWLLLEKPRTDGAIPAIADANSLQYVLHKSVGDEIVLPTGQRLRVVATLSDSVFQSELIVSESNFVKAFPEVQGYRVFLVKSSAPDYLEKAESALADQGFDATTTAARLAGFHRVENTYLSTFQTLGGLGLLLGTVGLAAVLIRNVFERRRELALLSAVGYPAASLQHLVLRENLFILAAGLGIGFVCALLAIAPALASRGAGFSLIGMLGLLGAVFLTGLAATWMATRVALRQPLLGALRAG